MDERFEGLPSSRRDRREGYDDKVLTDYVLVDDYLVTRAVGVLRRGAPVLHVDRCLSWETWVWTEPTTLRFVTLQGARWARRVTVSMEQHEFDLPVVQAVSKARLRALTADAGTRHVYHNLTRWAFGSKGQVMP